MKKWIILLLIGCWMISGLAQETKDASTVIADQHYRVYRGSGEAASLDDVIAAAKSAQVVFLGESHNDAVAHDLEKKILEQAWTPGLALSLEMFESDIQYVVDEYLAGLISEEHLLSSGRAWRNYKKDYAPLVEFAKEKNSPVIAANPPRRYVNRVSRLGASALQELDPQAKQFLPPLPYAKASASYEEKFNRVMEEARSGSNKLTPEALLRNLEAQSLWDAGMAYSIANFLTRNPGKRVLHVNGSFHTAYRLGIVEHLTRYRPDAKSLVITMSSEKSFPEFDREKMMNQGDFVIVTDPALPRSYTSTFTAPAKKPEEKK